MNSPERLYKYEAFTTRSLLNLKRQIIYFGSPLRFNDPYDCALTPNIAIPTDEEVEQLREAYLAKPMFMGSGRNEFEILGIDALRELLVRVATDVVRKEIDKFLKERGVACFSEKYDDLLMWSHYGGRYKGFCLEFSTTSEALAKARPVNYVTSLPEINVVQALLNNAYDLVTELFCTKSAAWFYECEWRAMHATVGTEFTYSAHDLTGVYFGPDIDRQSLEMVCLILAGQNGSVRLWEGIRSASEFRVEFKEFTYITHLEAKKRGLL